MTKSKLGSVLLILSLLFFVLCHSGEKSRLVVNLESGKRQTIVTYGTSLTAGGAWVGQLQQALDSRYPGQATVINSGKGAMWSKWGVDNLEERVIQKKPDTVLIEFAINDAYLPCKTSVVEAYDAVASESDHRSSEALEESARWTPVVHPGQCGSKDPRPARVAYQEAWRQLPKTLEEATPRRG